MNACDEAKLLDLLALRTAGIPPRELLALFGPEPTLLPLELPSLWEAYGPLLDSYRSVAEEELSACAKAGVELTPFFAEDYPAGLGDLRWARPLLLYSRGDRTCLERSPRLAIVGTRRPSPAGYEAAYRLAAEEAERGTVILSGLAHGCDEAAHRGTLAVGGASIAVVATGLDRVHPEGHASLQEQLLERGGLVVSEYPLGVPVEPYRLVQRNRLQAALAEALLVAECGLQSGTLHTVLFAERCRRPVYVLPSSGLPSQEGNAALLEAGRAHLYPSLSKPL